MARHRAAAARSARARPPRSPARRQGVAHPRRLLQAWPRPRTPARAGCRGPWLCASAPNPLEVQILPGCASSDRPGSPWDRRRAQGASGTARLGGERGAGGAARRRQAQLRRGRRARVLGRRRGRARGRARARGRRGRTRRRRRRRAAGRRGPVGLRRAGAAACAAARGSARPCPLECIRCHNGGSRPPHTPSMSYAAGAQCITAY